MYRVLQYQYMYEFMPQNERNYAFLSFYLAATSGDKPYKSCSTSSPW